ncbi:MAG TPA: hypothetical protein VFK41_04995 [Nocardioidaceae bacterium]|nr:hypothetical protein [Nocardioidaceae bacterium]
MTNQHGTSTAAAISPTLHALFGTVLLMIGGTLFVNVNEDPELFIAFSAAFMGPGLYLLIIGAVARGIELGRR